VNADQLNSCNSPLTVPQYGIRERLVPGDNLIEFTPDKVGTITYTCWMGMIASSIRVVPDVARLTAQDLQWRGDDRSNARRQLTADSVQIAKIDGGVQIADIRVDENGYAPAVVVAKKGVKTKIAFTVARLTSCNAIVDFPEYQGRLNLAQGQTETPLLDVSEDFRFQCGMGMLYGYVKIVDDPSRVDRAAVAREVSTRIPVGGRSCCAR
jgi:plastocyanin domain-containing protein